MKKKLVSVMAAAGLLLAGCSSATLGEGNSQGNVTAEKKAEDLKVGVSMSTLNNPFFISVKDGIMQLAQEKKTKVIISDAQNDVSKQSSDIEDLIQQKVDVIMVNPIDAAAIQTSVESANGANIPVIAVDRSPDGGDILTVIASDNVKGGEMAADFIVQKAGRGAKVVQLEGLPGASATRERGKGFENIAKKDLSVVQSQSAGFDRAKGLTVMENIIQSHPDIAAVFAQNDEMALGAIEALKASGKEDVLVIGFDGNEDALKAVKAGTMNATVAQQPAAMGKMALQAAYDHFEGKKVDSKIDSPLELLESH